MENIYIDKYIEWKAIHAQRAAVMYRIWLIKLFQFLKSDFKTWTIDDIVRFQVNIQMRYAPGSLQFCVAVLKNFLKFWFLQGVTKISPELIKIPRIGQKEMQYITEEDYRKILGSLDEDETFQELRRKLVVQILFKTGVRVSELCSLSISHLDVENRSALVRTRKNHKFRKIFWDDETSQTLEKYLKLRMEISQGSDSLFIGLGRGGDPTRRFSIRGVQRDIKELCDRAQLTKKLSVHSFRHGKGHALMLKNAPMPLISKVLGHSNPNSTFVYTQYIDKDFEQHAKNYL